MIQALRRKRRFFLAALVKGLPAFIGMAFVLLAAVKDEWRNWLLVALLCANALLWLTMVLTTWDTFRRRGPDWVDEKTAGRG